MFCYVTKTTVPCTKIIECHLFKQFNYALSLQK